MIEQTVTNRHFVIPLTDTEMKDVRIYCIRAGLNIKDWMRIAILEKLEIYKEE